MTWEDREPTLPDIITEQADEWAKEFSLELWEVWETIERTATRWLAKEG